MDPLAERVLGHIRRQELLTAGDRVGVAVSGGSDSVALLRLLLELRHELGVVVSVLHFNHTLRGAESDADQEFVTDLARAHELEFHCGSGDVAKHAAQERCSVETAARDLRYAFFRRLLGAVDSPQGLKPSNFGAPDGTAEAVPFPSPADFGNVPFRSGQASEAMPSPNQTCLHKIATGHTLDDQAETVLMRVIRGTGLRGLSGIHPRLLVDERGCGEIVRPLLGVRRVELQQYLERLDQRWREDASNADDRFTRNRVRQLVLPILEREFNPAVAGNLAELAEIARGEEDYWENEAAGWWGTTVRWLEAGGEPDLRGSALVQIQPSTSAEPSPALEDEPTALDVSVNRSWFLTEPVAVQRRVLRAIADEAGIQLEFRHVEEILRFAADRAVSGKALSLPQGWKMACEPEELLFVAPDRQVRIPQDYDCELLVPGRIVLAEASSVIEAVRVNQEREFSGYNPHDLLDAASLASTLRVRNWRAGDRFWPAHTKSPKKIKDLLQERHIAQPVRKAWPVVVQGNEIIWMRGFPVPAHLQAKPGSQAVLIRETDLQ